MGRVYVLVWLDNKGLNDFYAPYRDLHINDLQKGGFFTVLMGLWCVSMVWGVIVRVITRQRGAKPRTRYSPKGKGEKRMAKRTVKIGDELFSPTYGFIRVEEFRGNGKDKEFKISLLDEEYWLPVSKIRD